MIVVGRSGDSIVASMAMWSKSSSILVERNVRVFGSGEGDERRQRRLDGRRCGGQRAEKGKEWNTG